MNATVFNTCHCRPCVAKRGLPHTFETASDRDWRRRAERLSVLLALASWTFAALAVLS